MSVCYAVILLCLVGSIASHLHSGATPVLSTTHLQPISKACNEGDVTMNDCNKCVCTSDHFYNCISKPCNRTVLQNPKNNVACEPNMKYIKNDTACLCKEDGSWPHATCIGIFNSFQYNISKDTCEPNTFLIVDCNVCKCGLDGRIDKKHCTKNKCKTDKKKSRRYIKQNQVYGSCEAQNWYSLASCQFCYCIRENKLVCNTGNGHPRKVQLGSYSLSICGKDLIKDAINLIPDKDQALRNKLVNKTMNEPGILGKTTEFSKYSKLNDESNEKIVERLLSEELLEQQQIQEQLIAMHKLEQQQLEQKPLEQQPREQQPLEQQPLEQQPEQQPLAQQQIEQQLIEQQQIQQQQTQQQQTQQQQQKNVNDSDEYDTDSDESKAQPLTGNDGSSTRLPYEEDDENPSSESEKETEPDTKPDIDNEPSKLINSIRVNKDDSPLKPAKDLFPKHFEWPDRASEIGQINESFNLGEVLKPYLPVVLDKVFQMALRKSMVSIDPHSSCTPGSTTVLKCNACFCLKNNKLLCTNNECK